MVQIKKGVEPRHLKEVLADKNLLKIFHFARFDVAAIKQNLGIDCAPIYCTKIAHKLVRTSSDAHSLKALCKEFLNIELEKEQQVSDWGAEELSEKQQHYAANDVLYLHAIKEKLDALLIREGRQNVAEACFNFMSARAELDLQGFDIPDIFAH